MDGEKMSERGRDEWLGEADKAVAGKKWRYSDDAYIKNLTIYRLETRQG